MTDETEARPRRGRPRAEDVAAIDRRILDAATAVFLDQGYGRATMEQVAEVAKAGKTTLYSRYPTKADLFASVVTQSGAIFELANHAPTITGSKRDRLITAGNELAEFTLTPESIALMRATFAERDAFPEIAREGFRLGFEDCARHIARALAGTTDAPAVEAELPAAQRFVELALHPLYMHAFFGADLADLRQRAPVCVAEVVDFLFPAQA